MWSPQPGPQLIFVRCEAFEAVYGGARGGGKTDAALGDFALHALQFGRHAKGLLVRRTRVALEPTLERAKDIYAECGARFEASRSRFRFPNGAVLYLRHLDRDADAEGYQGHDYTRVYVEELTQFPSPRPVEKLKATLRSATGVPCGFRATCNPGGPGHAWVKAAYVDGSRMKPLAGGLARAFIPAKLADNPALLASDPLYVERLRLSGSESLVRAWLEGDWDLLEGAFFDKWSGANIVRDFAVPAHWTRLRSFDWGYAAPFSVGWWAIASDPTAALSRGGPVVIPRGALVRHREWYGCSGEPNVGLRLEAEAVARGIAEREVGEAMADAVADPSIFAQNGGPSIAERMARAGVRFRPADNTRVGAAGALSGWDQVRARIAGQGDGPMLYAFETCAGFIRTMPALQHDPTRAEDLDTRGEDHVADETRYACLSRPLTAPAPRATPADDHWARLRRAETAGWKAM
ncbi:MAG TPA: terminase family protein [Caulobacteraceae bacterium]|jgi:hypothetical protein|nr:terminase family protein [Caulobacteraceae bacterium]